MYDWVDSYKTLRSGRLIHTSAPPTWPVSKRRSQRSAPRAATTFIPTNNVTRPLASFWYDPDNEEFEFDWEPEPNP